MKNKINMGDTIGRLKIIKFMGKNERYHKIWLCECSCKNQKIVMDVHLKSKATKSCGCLLKEKTKENNTIHGFNSNTTNKTKGKFYKIWKNIKQRCNNVNNTHYKDYGGRGIIYDPRWEDFLEFKRDMYFKYLYAKKQLKIKNPSIERKDVNGNYCKENCTWIELIDQAKNKRSQHNQQWFKAISPEGKEYISNNQNEFARKHNLSVSSINRYINNNEKKKYKNWQFILLDELNNFKLYF
jgi:hypothetical protein